MASQVQVQHEAAQNRQQLYSQNKGRPAVAVAARPIASGPRAAGGTASDRRTQRYNRATGER